MKTIMRGRPGKRAAVTVLAAAISVSLLGMTACSSTPDASSTSADSDSEQSSVVFDFPQNQLAPAETVSASVPDGLKKAAGLDDDEVLVTKFVLLGRKLDTADNCAFDVDVTYSDSGRDALLDDVSAFANGSSLEDYEILEGWILRRAPVYDQAFDPADSGKDDINGVYVSEDGHRFTVVSSCGASATDAAKSVDVHWPVKSDSGVVLFATLSVVPMANGTIGVTGNVDDYVRDANGDWIKS